MSKWLLLAALVCAAGCRSALESGLDEHQADEVVVVLDSQGIGATKERDESGRFRIMVESSDVAPALAILRSQDLPRESQQTIADVYGEPGLVPSATEERARYAAAISGELSRSLEAMDGVERARVHLAVPSGRTLTPEPPRASVLLALRRNAHVDDSAVRALVAGAFPDLRAEDVAVVRSTARATAQPDTRLAQLGPFSVSRSSEPLLRAVLGGSFALNLILALVLLWRWRRRPGTALRSEPAE
jgi:type III secretion protein J